MSLKLLAIRPLEKCSERLLKNLKMNELYKFYNNYKFNFDTEGRIQGIDPIRTPIDNLYNQKSLKINISAIVGRNGSGKSTLIELLIVCINQVSYRLKKEGKLGTDAYIIDISKTDKIHCEIYYEINDKIYLLEVNNNHISLRDVNDGNTDIKNSNIKNFPLKDFFYTEIIN